MILRLPSFDTVLTKCYEEDGCRQIPPRAQEQAADLENVFLGVSIMEFDQLSSVDCLHFFWDVDFALFCYMLNNQMSSTSIIVRTQDQICHLSMLTCTSIFEILCD